MYKLTAVVNYTVNLDFFAYSVVIGRMTYWSKKFNVNFGAEEKDFHLQQMLIEKHGLVFRRDQCHHVVERHLKVDTRLAQTPL